MSWEHVPLGDSSFSYNRMERLGRGGYGWVFSGKYNGKDVAVKRVQLIEIDTKKLVDNKTREEKFLAQLNHENIIKLIDVRDNTDFRFYVLERCAANLDDYCKGVYQGSIPSEAEVLYQLTSGLEHIHSICIHRDIKPANILISNPDPIAKMKWADFGLSKAINKNGSCSMSGNPGTENWKAPEVLRLRVKPNGRGSKESDIFPTGLVFFYFLTRVHPFEGASQTTESNIRNNNPVNLHELAENHFAKNIIIKMIAHKIKDRMALKDIIQELEPHLPKNSSRDAANQLLANRAPGAEAVGSHKPMPSAVAKLPKKRTLTKEPKENIMSIVDVLSQKRKLPRWAIKARVIEKTPVKYMASPEPSIPAKKYFDLTLEDETGKVQARVCTAKYCKQFYTKFQVGKQYLIKQLKMRKSSDNNEPFLSFQGKTEVSCTDVNI